jgi:phosphoglycolate phosphatase
MVMVGDMRYDMETAVNAGSLPIGVSYGYGSEAELMDAGARLIVPDFPALVDLLA